MKRYLLLIASITCFCNAETNLRWGILSTATIAHRFVEALKQSSRSHLVAVASRSLDKAQQFAEKHDIACAYGSYEELLADESINVVYIPLPNNLHAEWIIKAAEKGKHVLCEKPIVLSMEEMEHVQKAAEEHKVVIMEGLMYLHHPQTLVVEEIIRKGLIGDIVHIKAWLDHYMPNKDAICLHPEFGGGTLWNFGIYPLSFALLIAGQQPIHVHASAKANEFNCDAALESELLFSSCSAHISCNMISPSSKGASIIGTKGRIEIPNPWTPGRSNEEITFQVITHEYGVETITIPTKNPYLCEIEDMERCVLENAEPRIPLTVSKIFLQAIIDVYTDATQCCYK